MQPLAESYQGTIINPYFFRHIFFQKLQSSQICWESTPEVPAPEIDNEVLIASSTVEKEIIGSFQNVKINECSEYDLYGTIIKNPG